VTFSKIPISFHSVVDIVSSDMVVRDDGGEVTIFRSHRLSTLLNIRNVLLELFERKKNK